MRSITMKLIAMKPGTIKFKTMKLNAMTVVLNRIKLGVSASLVAAVLSACGGSSDSESIVEELVPGENIVVVKTVAADYSGSNIQIVDISDSYSTTAGLIPSDQSDYTIARFGQYFYHIGRYSIDTISQYDIEDATNALYEYSTLDDAEDATSNPYTLVFASDEKAYLIRYASDKVWIVNPNAETEADFKIGELDLSAYADSDENGVPEAADGIIVDGKLYIMMQRLQSFSPADEGVNAYVAVFDIDTDTEIDTNPNDAIENRKGIELDIRNPNKLVYQENVGLFVQASGDTFGEAYYGRAPGYTGGVSKIDTDNYSLTMIVDDGSDTEGDHPYGYIYNLAIVDADNAFFLGYEAYQTTTLYHFNPTTGAVSGAISDVTGLDVSTLAVGPEGNTWVGISDAADPRISLLDTTGTILDTISLIENPTAIKFSN